MSEAVVAPAEQVPAGANRSVGPGRLALRRLRKNKIGIFFGILFLIIVILCLLAPVYASHVAHQGPLDGTITGTVYGKDIVNQYSTGIGPTWHSRYLLGADSLGRDVAVRLLYGGRNSLEIGALATIITIVGATILGVCAGFFRGWVDTIISRILDIIWAYPALLLAIALGVSLAVTGVNIGPWHIAGTSNLVPSAIIGVVYIPYVARPIRGEVLTLREREYVDAARILGYNRFSIIVREILPNLFSTLLVFVALQLAQSIILEASLSFLGAGVQPPNPSWGTMLADGSSQIEVAPHLVLVPGIMLVVAVVSVNVFGDALRQAFDPRARIRVER